MSVVIILIVASLTVALLFLGGYIWAVRSGQFEDTYTPSLRVLVDEPPGSASNSTSAKKGELEKS